MANVDDIAECFWEMNILYSLDDKEQFMSKVKPVIKKLIKKIKEGDV